MQVAVYGGSFDQVLVVPVFAHAFGKELAPFEHRVAMTRLAMSGLGDVHVSTIERDLGAPSRTLRTLEKLREIHPEWVCRLVVGTDVLAEKEKWHAFDEVVKLSPLFVLGRVGAYAPHSSAPPAVLP